MSNKIVVGISNKHMHISREDLDTLFGKGYELKVFKELGQPGQYAAEEKLDIVGPKGTIKGIRILGPIRPKTQIELALSDARAIGINAPIRESGDVAGSPGAKLIGPLGEVEIKEGVIIALRHIHLTEEEAKAANVKDKEFVSLRFEGPRAVTFDNVLIRVNVNFSGEIHLDTDEGNAGCVSTGDMGEIIKK
ncbi:MAG: phosphate propanoyltransferase [Eubacteriales bacterium]